MDKKTLLIVDDEENLRHMLCELLKSEGYAVTTAANGEEGLQQLDLGEFDAVLCDVRMPVMDGLAFLQEARRRNVPSAIIMMSAYSSVDLAVEAMKRGATDYVSKPFKVDEILLKLQRAQEQKRLQQENLQLRKTLREENCFASILARSERMRALFDTVARVAAYKTTVLIVGESGTGKELLAKAIHFNSPRADRPFVAINCGAIPENLLESELFGHRKGAFTDAVRTKRGLFEEAHEGTLFLDEIGELPLSLQVKLLRAIQEEEIRRVGDNQTLKVDVRIVAATVHDLARKVQEGAFRSDLYYRLNVLTLRVPPLRERRDDISLLMNHFLQKFNQKLGTRVESFSPEAYQLLLAYPWPGNVRELENVVERAIILSTCDVILPDALTPEIREYRSARSIPQAFESLSLKKANRLLEQDLIARALKAAEGNHTKAAKILEISHRALLYKLKYYNLK